MATVPSVLPASPRIEHRLWLDRPRFLSLVRRRWLVVIGSTAVYLIGLTAAALFTAPGLYLKSPAFAFGAIGIVWVFASIRTKSRIVDDLYADLYVIFSVDKKTFYDHVEGHFTAICRVRPQLCIALPLLAVNISAAWVAFYHYPLVLGDQPQHSVRPWMFDNMIFNFSLGPAYFWIVAGFAVPISIMLAVSTWLLLRELVLVRSLTGLPVVPLASAVRARLKPLADLHVRAAADWSLGALLFFILFSRTPDVLSATFIGLLVFVAFAVLIAPQLFLTSIVRRAHEKACALALYDYHEKISRNADARYKFEYLADVATVTERPRLWVYSADELLRWLSAQLLALTALFIQIASIN